MFYTLIGMLMTFSSQADTARVPEWAVGEWTGSMGYEHDTLMYDMKLSLSDKPDSSRLMILSPSETFLVNLESADTGSVHLLLKPVSSKDTITFSGGTLDLMQVDYFPPNVLHVQFYPKGSEKVWLGEVKRDK